MFRLMWTCRQMGCDYVIRSGHDRLVSTQDQQASDKLYAYVSRQPLLGQRVLHLDSTPTQRERAAQVELRLCHLWLTPSSDERVEMLSQDAHGQLQALETWVIQVKEVHPPTKGAVERHPPAGAEQELIEPLEWVLLTSVPTQTAAQAWQRVQWYTCRWIVEEYHHGLKTGCRLEDRKVRDAAALQRLIAILAPMALRLLQVRWWARTAPAQPALDCLPAQPVEVMARVLQCPPASITAGQFWRQVAQWGGYLGRTSDGPPGWKTLWKGWFHLQTLLDGFQLASSPPP
jgi:hypothetical protein